LTSLSLLLHVLPTDTAKPKPHPNLPPKLKI
jgi:hypothetical protein